ncbi:phosphoribosylanthranilate isomerase [Alsobacter sp. SYSU M60028]|uniref:N-(5'-phosphoribosyl)anthranilate isomerase n=1 Tax=Alsobacter ponti TaxID=2962936 RepID=A0ABT1LD41_9HYPH|nr:phosphoribosylanthranilate isomerase [Alsobacter ponti]MCP8938813.1 phosphoribosylanthranilate isomerase [Alsobacter ponti]
MTLTVKICGLRTPETLEAALDAGADMVGFVFFPRSPRHLQLSEARTLGALVAGRAERVALTVDADDALLDSIVEALRPEWLQLHGQESPGRVAAVRSRYGLPIIKALGVSGRADLARAAGYADVADRLLFDAKPPKDALLPGGNGVPFDWEVLSGLDLGKPFMVSGGLDADNVAAALAVTGAPGVDVSSGVESAPGVKDPARIASFVLAARAGAARPRPAPPGAGALRGRG